MENRKIYSVYNCLLMHRIKYLIPVLAPIIEAESNIFDFEKGYDAFLAHSHHKDDYNEEYWKLKGKRGSMSVMFERHESYLHFHVFTVFTDTEEHKRIVENMISNYMGTYKNREQQLQKKKRQ